MTSLVDFLLVSFCVKILFSLKFGIRDWEFVKLLRVLNFTINIKIKNIT